VQPFRLYQCTWSTCAAAAVREGSSNTKGFLPLDEGFLQHATTRLPVTRSATTFVDNNVEYLSSIDGIDLQELNDLFNKVPAAYGYQPAGMTRV
jgi:hypothetical protein